MHIVYQQGLQEPQKLSSLKSLKIQNPPLLSGIFNPATIINVFLIKIQCGKTVKNVQIDPQTTDTWLKRLNVRE